MPCCLLLLLAACLVSCRTTLKTDSAAHIQTPRLVGDWWQVAGDPDLGKLTTTNQQPVDFAIWQAADGTWQIWSCIRKTKEPGNTRLFHRWEGKKLTDTNWKPMGIAMQADEKHGERRGGLQAPYVFRTDERFLMHYGSWDYICTAQSNDGKKFTRIVNPAGQTRSFGELSDTNTRDPMTIRIGNTWHCYYSAHPERRGAVYCRTSLDLKTWSAAHMVARAGRTGTNAFSSECPFVVELSPGNFYLFRTQKYGVNAQTSVYFSKDPLNFGVDNDEGYFVCTLPVAAPEIFKHEGQWYMAALLPSLKGIQIGRLAWEPARSSGKN